MPSKLCRRVVLAVRMLGWVVVATSQMGFVVSGYTEHLKAPYDPACNYMKTTPAPIMPHLRPDQFGYFDAEIPKQVHQIWFGDKGRMDQRGSDLWQSFSTQFGYSYRLWTEADADEFKGFMPEENFELWRQYMRLGNFYGASDLLRLSLLEKFGGTYVDMDIWPPQWDDKLIDLATLVPMRNIVLMTEKSSRNVIESSLFVANGFIMTAPNHPLIKHLVENIEANVTALNEGPLDDHSPEIPMHTMYMTGPFFVSRSLAGVFTILPFNYGTLLKMREYEPGAN